MPTVSRHARALTAVGIAAVSLTAPLAAQRPQFNSASGFITVDAPVIALANVRVIDGTGVRRARTRR